MPSKLERTQKKTNHFIDKTDRWKWRSTFMIWSALCCVHYSRWANNLAAICPLQFGFVWQPQILTKWKSARYPQPTVFHSSTSSSSSPSSDFFLYFLFVSTFLTSDRKSQRNQFRHSCCAMESERWKFNSNQWPQCQKLYVRDERKLQIQWHQHRQNEATKKKKYNNNEKRNILWKL